MSLMLEEIELIKRLKYRYWRTLDTADVDGLRGCWAEDATVSYIGGSYRFELKGREEIVTALSANFRPGFLGYHIGHHPEIDIVDETHATGIWYLTDWSMLIDEGYTLEGTAFYHDRYVKTGGRWLIQHSGYERNYEKIDPISPDSKITAHLFKKLGDRRLKPPQ
jgi:hypothetical protein